VTKVGNLTGAAAAFATATASYRADAEGDAVPAEQKFKYGLAYYNHARMLDLQVPARLLLRHTARRVKSAYYNHACMLDLQLQHGLGKPVPTAEEVAAVAREGSALFPAVRHMAPGGHDLW
jgi:hypothetical protein